MFFKPTNVSLMNSPLMADTSVDQFGLNSPLLNPRVAQSPLYARLFDKFTVQDPNDPVQLGDDDKRKLFRRGLLAFAAASAKPNGGNFADSLATGLLAANGAMQNGLDGYGSGNTTDLQTFKAMTRGMTPDEIAQARRIHLGLSPRAVTGAMKFDTFTDSQGRARPQRNNPTTGNVEIYYDESGQWLPLGQSAGAPSTTPPAIPSVPQATPITYTAADGQPIPQQDYPAIEAVIRAQQAGRDATVPVGRSMLPPGLAVGQTPAAKAGSEEAARQSAQLSALPQRGAIEAQNAGAAERAKALANAAVAPQVAAGQATIEGAKQQAQAAAATYQASQDKGATARNENAKLFQLKHLLANTYTGTGAGTALTAKKALATLGINSDGLGEAQAAQALSNQLTLAMRNPAGGEGMPGAMSDADRVFLQSSVPSLANTPDGWRRMIDMRIALNEEAIRQQSFAAGLLKRGVPIEHIPAMLQEYANHHSVFSGQGASRSGSQRVLKFNPATGRIE